MLYTRLTTGGKLILFRKVYNTCYLPRPPVRFSIPRIAPFGQDHHHCRQEVQENSISNVKSKAGCSTDTWLTAASRQCFYPCGSAYNKRQLKSVLGS